MTITWYSLKSNDGLSFWNRSFFSTKSAPTMTVIVWKDSKHMNLNLNLNFACSSLLQYRARPLVYICDLQSRILPTDSRRPLRRGRKHNSSDACKSPLPISTSTIGQTVDSHKFPTLVMKRHSRLPWGLLSRARFRALIGRGTSMLHPQTKKVAARVETLIDTSPQQETNCICSRE